MSAQNPSGDQFDLSGDFRGATINIKSTVGSGLAREFRPPLQRPPRPEHFTGRQNELDALLSQLKPGAVVSLSGPPGIGKTALACEAIWRLAPGDDPPALFPEGVFYHAFYQRPESALCLEAIALAFGEEARPTPKDAAQRALAGRRALLFLDGAEQADDIASILDVRDRCGVLITTRHRDAPGEQSQVQPLPPDEAVQLLQAWGVERAADGPVVRQICALVGNLPLAVRLVGSYLSSRGEDAADYLAWLSKSPLQALDLGKRQSESVPLLFGRSLEPLSGTAREALAAASLLALAPIPRPILAAALDIPEDDLRRPLGELVNSSLMQRSDQGYSLVHPLVHTVTRQRLAAAFTSQAEGANAQGLEGYRRLDRLLEHILSVLAALAGAGEWGAILDLSRSVVEYLDRQGRWQVRLGVCQAALRAARSLPDRGKESSWQNNLGNAYLSLGDSRQAIEYYNQALVIAREIGDRRVEGADLGNLGLAYAALGDSRQAIEYYEQALAIDREIGDRRGEGADLGNLGAAYAKLGDPRRAIEYYDQALAIDREIGDRRGEGADLGNLGNSYSNLGDPRQAIEYYEQTLAIAREIGDRRMEGNSLGNLGFAYSDLGDPRQAIEYYEQALAIAREIGVRSGESNHSWNLADELENLGELQRAADLMQFTVDYEREIGHPDAEEDAARLAELRSRLSSSGGQ